MYFFTLVKDQNKNTVINNVNVNVVFIPYVSNKTLAHVNIAAPAMVDTIARVDKTVPRSLDDISS